ncbi:MAG: hypothetical protein ACO38D_07985, partial [Ilumatobacteraceae bacterium]
MACDEGDFVRGVSIEWSAGVSVDGRRIERTVGDHRKTEVCGDFIQAGDGGKGSVRELVFELAVSDGQSSGTSKGIDGALSRQSRQKSVDSVP